MINLRVETLIQLGHCQLSAPSMHKVKTGVQNMYMKSSPKISIMKERLSHLFICGCVQVEFLSNHKCKVCTVVSVHNVTLATAHSREVDHFSKRIKIIEL